MTVVLLWGSSFTIVKLGLHELSPINLAFLRFLLALPFFFGYTLIRDRRVLETSVIHDWKRFTLLGLTGVTLYHVFQNVGLQYTTVANSSLITSANPVFIAILDHFYCHNRLTVPKFVGVLLGFVGVILVIDPLKLRYHPLGVIGDLFSLGASLSWAVYSVFGKRILPKYGAPRVTAYSMAVGLVCLLPLLLAMEQPALPSSLQVWGFLCILSLLCSGVGYLLWYTALEEASVTSAAVFLFFLPVVSVLFATVFLFEPLNPIFLVGAAFVLIGVLLAR
jgi:drug/metabolite transporter (DMT)-like permease